MYSTIERMDGCAYSLEIIIVPLEERTTRTNFFENKHTAAERITETMDERDEGMQVLQSKIKIVHFKESMTTILSLTKTGVVTSRNVWLQLE